VSWTTSHDHLDIGSVDLAVLDFMWQLGEVAASGGDVREFLFGPPALAA
jgi:hypothetical protein